MLTNLFCNVPVSTFIVCTVTIKDKLAKNSTVLVGVSLVYTYTMFCNIYKKMFIQGFYQKYVLHTYTNLSLTPFN